MTYNQALEKWNTSKARSKKDGYIKIANNTYLNYYDQTKDFTIRLHQTHIISLFVNGNYKLNTGGWYSHTTKDRLNSYSPARISQNKGTWKLYHSSGVYDFETGMIIDGTGKPFDSRLLNTRLTQLYLKTMANNK